MAGGPLAERIRARVAEDVKGLGGIGLATVQVGEDPASTVYIRRKHEAAGEAVIASTDLKLPEDISQEALVAAVELLNADDEIDGILVQLPLPQPPRRGRRRCWRSTRSRTWTACTRSTRGSSTSGGRRSCPRRRSGSWRCSRSSSIGLDGARAVVIGRSDIVGKPIAHLLLQANATVTICHSHTDDLERHTLDADVLVVAAGVPGIVSPDMVKSGAAVVDVGINRTEAGLVGDVDPGAAAHRRTSSRPCRAASAR